MTISPDAPNPSPVLSWLIQSARVHWLDQANLPPTDAVLVTDDAQTHLLSSLARSSHHHIIGIPLGSDTTAALETAIQHARSLRLPLIPVGLAIAPTIKLPFSRTLPMPRANIVIGVEVPFQVPDRPLEIPAAWVDAINTLLKRARGRALDTLATIQRR